jgi:hypothetical protein
MLSMPLSRDERRALRAEVLGVLPAGVGWLAGLSHDGDVERLTDTYAQVRRSLDLLDAIGLADCTDTLDEDVVITDPTLQLLVVEIVASVSAGFGHGAGDLPAEAVAAWAGLDERLIGVDA